jgi:hypothetical protein
MDALTPIGINCVHTSRLIASLISKLAAYAEEGVPLAPTIFVCNSVPSLVGMMGAGEHVSLSATWLANETAASKILKAAAYLAVGSWKIYVERSEDGSQCRFGIFCGSTDPSSATPDEVLFQENDPGFPIVRIKQVAPNKVEMRTSDGNSIEFRFNDDEDVIGIGNEGIFTDLARCATAGIDEVPTEFVAFVRRILVRAIHLSHGTLIAVVPAATGIPAQLTDGLSITPPIDLRERFETHVGGDKVADTLSRLQAASALLSGFVGSDGITVLDDSGKILAYRAFIKAEGDQEASDGGARTRAYLAMAALIPDSLAATYFRSQDGRMMFKKKEVDG